MKTSGKPRNTSPVRRALARLGVCAALAVVAIGASSKDARAEEPNDYCRKVSERASADAALLFAPRAAAQVARYPRNAVIDSLGLQLGDGVQPRAAMTIELVDVYKGFGVLDVARKDCRRQEAALILQELLLARAEIGQRPALERKIAYLREHEGEVTEVIDRAEERLSAGTSTILEVGELRRRQLGLARKRLDAEAALEAVKIRDVRLPVKAVEQVLRRYEASSVAFEQSVDHVRSLSPWKLGITGAVVVYPNVDYLGVAELSYSLGGPFQRSADKEAVKARAAELRNARYEMRRQITTLLGELRASAEAARRQASLLDVELERIARERAMVEATDAPNRHQVLAVLTLSAVELEAERVFMNTLARTQSAFGGRT